MIQRRIYVNKIERNIFAHEDSFLSTVLREQLGLYGTKVGCGEGQCGACSVILDGKLVRSCITKFSRVNDYAQITTIEGIGQPDKLHPIQLAWIKHGAAQCGFCTPGFIVSAKALLDSNLNPTREEARDWFQKHRNACRCTGYIPIVDAVMDAAKVLRGEMKAEELLFVLPSDGRIWGSRYPRPTAEAKVRGTIEYGGDIGLQLPSNVLHIALVQAEVSHANIKGIDTSKAEKMPGVFKVITHKDIAGRNRISGMSFPTNKGDGWERPILNDNKIFQIGDAIAMVCASTYEEACEAAKQVKLDLEILPAYMNAHAAKAPDAIEIHPGTPNHYFTQKLLKGDDTAPFFNDSNNSTVEVDIATSRQPHLPMEPDVGFAYVDKDGKVHVHSKSIGIHLHHAMIYEGVGIKAEDLYLASNPMGGTFGYKFSPTMEALVAVAANVTRRPVFLKYNYKQQQQYTGKRSPFFINIKMSADKNGKLKAMQTSFDVDHGPYSEFGDLLTLRGIQYMGSGYDIPNIRGEGRTICTNHVWGSAFRGYGGPQSSMASETAMDILAHKMGIDPLELRYKNVYRKGCTNITGQEPDSYSLASMCEELKPKYEAALAKAKKESSDTHKKGVGIAVGVYGSGLDGVDSSEAYIELKADGSVTVGSSWEDHGQGADAGAIGVAHEALRALKIKPENLHFTWPDMAKTPNSGPAGGSRSQVMTGGAIRVACENTLAALKKADGSYMTYAELIAAGKPTKYEGKFSVPGVPCDENGLGKPFMVYMYALYMAEITLELASGKVAVDKMTAFIDVGKINNKLVVDGQIYGGLAQALGYALSEDFEDYEKHSNLIGAGLPYIKDIPDNIELRYFEEPREYGVFGAAGCGEIPLCGPSPAILNAIFNASGARITQIPARPNLVLEALKNLK